MNFSVRIQDSHSGQIAHREVYAKNHQEAIRIVKDANGDHWKILFCLSEEQIAESNEHLAEANV